MADLAKQLTDAPENYVNDQSVEMAWAIKAAESATIHMNIVLSVDTTKLKLNKHQDHVYAKFREYFPELDVKVTGEDVLKNKNKDKWRDFCEEFKDSVDEYNLGTMLRINAEGIYDEQNTIVTNKIIFLAIEGARNIEGVNERCKPAYSIRYKESHMSGETNVL